MGFLVKTRRKCCHGDSGIGFRCWKLGAGKYHIVRGKFLEK